MFCGFLPVMHQFDAYYTTSYSGGIRWFPSPEVCRMVGAYQAKWYSRIDQPITRGVPNVDHSTSWFSWTLDKMDFWVHDHVMTLLGIMYQRDVLRPILPVYGSLYWDLSWVNCRNKILLNESWKMLLSEPLASLITFFRTSLMNFCRNNQRISDSFFYITKSSD